ncbi:MAG: preprotein translocase subunit SecY [Oscillospiraceae bacterium]|nr:preprotein translocase subunit SecY [Oscillospiraceae bacterium]
MFESVRNAWRIPDLRRKLFFTLFALLIYRFGANIPVPGIDQNTLVSIFNSTMQNTIFGMQNMLSGGALSQGTIFALSIQPYINASIIMQLLTIGIPALERMQKEGGEEGKKKIAAITRYVTVALALLLGFAYYTMLRNQMGVVGEGAWTAIIIILTFTAGSAFIMWLGEQITEFGIGNGISIILFASIVSRGASLVNSMYTLIFPAPIENEAGEMVAQASQWWVVVLALVGVMLLVVFVVFITNAERRLPVQYAKRVVGRRMYGGQSTHLPLKVNMSGVMPIIFAQSIASFPATIAMFFGAGDSINSWFGQNSVLYSVVYFLLIIAFSYFYTSIQFNPVEIANNLKQNGGSIPGFRQGKPTSDFIKKVLGKITLFGALFLGVIAVLPTVTGAIFNVSSLALGGTSILIVVGVALETVKAIEAQMVMRSYKGFLE